MKKILVTDKKTGKVYDPEIEFKKIMQANINVFKRFPNDKN